MCPKPPRFAQYYWWNTTLTETAAESDIAAIFTKRKIREQLIFQVFLGMHQKCRIGIGLDTDLFQCVHLLTMLTLAYLATTTLVILSPFCSLSLLIFFIFFLGGGVLAVQTDQNITSYILCMGAWRMAADHLAPMKIFTQENHC